MNLLKLILNDLERISSVRAIKHHSINPETIKKDFTTMFNTFSSYCSGKQFFRTPVLV